MKATLVGLFVLGLASLSLNGNPGALSENVDCGSDSSNTFTYGNNCYTTGGYCTGSDACRAAQQGLKDQMVAPTGVACNNQDCVPGTCHTAVRCLQLAPVWAAHSEHGDWKVKVHSMLAGW